MINKFKCPYCKSGELVCQKWIDHREDVIIHENGHIEYGPPEIDADSMCGTGIEYICKTCERPLFYMGMWVTDEAELEYYLSHAPEDIEAANDEYIESQAEQHAALTEYEDCEMIDN